MHDSQSLLATAAQPSFLSPARDVTNAAGISPGLHTHAGLASSFVGSPANRPGSARPAASFTMAAPVDASPLRPRVSVSNSGLPPPPQGGGVGGSAQRPGSAGEPPVRPGSLSGLGHRLGTLLSLTRFGSRAAARHGSLGNVPEDPETGRASSHANTLAGGLTITKQQLMEALEKTYDKKLADAKCDPMERFADPQARMLSQGCPVNLLLLYFYIISNSVD